MSPAPALSSKTTKGAATPPPPLPPELGPGSLLPDAGTKVIVSVAPASGDPGAAIVAVPAKSMFRSQTMWVTSTGALYFICDALFPVAQDILGTDHPPTNWWTVVQKAGLALILAYLAWRRKTQNSVVN